MFFSYEDKDGNTFIQLDREKYMVNVQSKLESENETQVYISDEIDKKQVILVGIVVVLTIVIITLILIKRKKR